MTQFAGTPFPGSSNMFKDLWDYGAILNRGEVVILEEEAYNEEDDNYSGVVVSS